ncbi:hypothetical protein [Snodgrassella sp. CFCC 13594]|uniref:hypothetical protein n=1 Tax=Snodgrassella sp. CFCC 13594 TaxID=1775559 RepID=UPI0009EEF48D|nr:hypothetical protein [Snodgrassella sp. CFCC 13594]
MNELNKQRPQTIFALGIGLLLISTPSLAKVYTCIENGDVVYTSNPKGNCAVAQLPKIGSYSDSRPSYRTASAAPSVRAKPQPVSSRRSAAVAGPQPAVNIVPKGSDNSRRSILQQELANERRALTQAQQALSQGRAMKGSNYNQYQANVRQLEGAVLDRQQNIQALQRELGRM